jgi:predicted ATP-dependent protease
MNNPSNIEFKAAIAVVDHLPPESLTINIPSQGFSFAHTGDLLSTINEDQSSIVPAWILQSEAKQAAQFGLSIKQKGFNILALGEPGTGRSTLMLNAMREVADACKSDHSQITMTSDLIALYQFNSNGKPLFLTLNAGHGVELKSALDAFIRKMGKLLTSLVDDKVNEAILSPIKANISSSLKTLADELPFVATTPALLNHLSAIEKDMLDYLNAWQPSLNSDADNHIDQMLSETFMGRYRVNVLVANDPSSQIPVIVDYDPSLQSLFGGIEAGGESNQPPEFMRLRAGHLLRADGGFLLLHLRDILADEQNGEQILEKLHRFCRNGYLQIEDLSGGGQGVGVVSAQANIPVNVKIVLVTTREDYYEMLDEKADLFNFFPIKVEFSENVKANQANYNAFALFVAQKCVELKGQHFTAEAITGLLQAMHRLEEDQTRFSTNLGVLEKLIIESITIAQHAKSEFVALSHVKAAIARRYKRHSYIEGHIRESIVDQELMINVHGEAIGQVNGLTHIDLADASFGSPVRISANCYAGARGVVTIDREVTMSGPTHDKGVMIMQSWLQQHFCQFNPLNFTASLVFEQEYNGVDGDSASCAELFALMSSLTQLPIKQSIAVTGAMNQHGEVLPVGGINEKIEGYFRVCQDIGLNGKQGVLIPTKNTRHLILSDEVIQAVKDNQFHIATMSRVEEGLMYLMQTFMETINDQAIARLQQFKEIIESNRPIQKNKH